MIGCFKTKKNSLRKKVENDWADGYSLGVVGTPTFFVNNQKIEGSVPLSAWEQAINK